MSKEKFNELFEKIQKITGVQDIGYHSVRDGKLNPIYKSRTGEVSLEKWKAVHKENPVYIKDNSILQEIMEHKKSVIVADVKADPRSSTEFFLFGIDSLAVIPVLKDNDVQGILPIVSIGKIHNFYEEDILKCEEAVEEYKRLLIG